MGAGAVPVAGHGLGVEGYVDLVGFGDPVEKPSGHPDLVADEGRREYADLEFPLAHHDFCVGSLDR